MNTKFLERLGACREGREWAATQPDAATMWANCPRGDWLLWLWIRKIGDDIEERKCLVLAACQCARLVLHLTRDPDERPEIAIATAEQWALGDESVTLEDVRYAASAVAYAYAAHAAYASAYAASVERDRVRRQCADIVRKFIPEFPPEWEVTT